VVLRAILILALTACSQSLFDNNANGKDGGTTGDEMAVPNTCPAPCVGDAAADFDGTAGGSNMRWRYLEDRRNRTWMPMTPDAGGMLGADTNNRIAKCTAASTEHACQALPGALLISAAGMGAAADPAIELLAPMNQVVTVAIKVAVPPGAGEHQVRLYRGSREDLLYSGVATPTNALEASITIDALAKDRILFALTPTSPVQNVGVQMFVSGTADTFPKACQLAVAFSSPQGNNVDNLCGGDVGYENYTTGPIAPTLGTGPYTEQGMGADITPDNFYKATNIIDRAGDTTLQFWMRLDGLVDPYAAWIVSDMDLDDIEPGGLGVGIYVNAGLKLEVSTCTSGNPLMFEGAEMTYPSDGAWHFIRVVQKGTMVTGCIDGKRELAFAAPAGSLQSKYQVRFGRNVIWTPSGAFFDGGIDDVRVFNTALPCD
jgi:hypothetical protein